MNKILKKSQQTTAPQFETPAQPAVSGYEVNDLTYRSGEVNPKVQEESPITPDTLPFPPVIKSRKELFEKKQALLNL